MATLNFPSNPTIGDIYEFEPYRYTWDGEKWKTIGIWYNPAAKLSPTVRSNIQRLATEAGYNLVSGSFEDGGSLTTTVDVLWSQLEGKYYAWAGALPKVVAAASTPATSGGVGAGAWVDRTQETIRVELINLINASTMVGGLTLQTLTADQAKSETFKEGDKVYISDVGYVFTYKSSRYLIYGQSQSEITFDDTLHILVTGGGLLQFDDWAKAKRVQTQNAARFAAKLKDRTSSIALDCYGDSITFGQAQASTANSTNKIGVATGFGDGSTHQQWQFNNNYPQWVASYLANNIYQSSSVNNFGYSGDRTITGYLRHRIVTGSDAATIMYGINDCLFATSNGSTPSGLTSTGIYTVENYATALRLFAVKQIMQGKSVTILGTTPFGSPSGFDGTQFAAAKLARAYNAAAKKVAEELGCLYVDVAQDIFNQYGITEITQEGTHLGETGLKIAGNRIAAALVCAESTNRVTHGSVLIANPILNTLLSKDAVNILPNSTSSTPSGAMDGSRTTMVAGTNGITIPFYSDGDSLVMFVNGYCASSGATFSISLDADAVQSDFHFQGMGVSGKPTASKSVTKNAKFTRDTTNFSVDTTEAFLVVANKGWHSLTIAKVSGSATVLFDSLMFLSLDSILASDVYGTTARGVVTSSVLGSGNSAYNIASVSHTGTGTYTVTFANQLPAPYTVSVDTAATYAGNMYRVSNKSSAGFNLDFMNGAGAGAGMVFNFYNPTQFTFNVLGGR